MLIFWLRIIKINIIIFFVLLLRNDLNELSQNIDLIFGKNLFKKYTLNNNVEVRNRLVIAPLTLLGSNKDGTISEEEREYLEKRGTDIGLYIFGSTAVSQEGLTFLNQPRAYSEKDIPSLKARAQIIKAQGALAINQIHHGGALSSEEYSGLQPISPSSNNSNIHELNDKEINELIEKFRYSAELSLQAGFDGVEIHGANKYLLQQFYSPHTNQRNDRWGGSDENRMSFILKIIDAICNMRDEHKRSDFIIGYRLSPEEPFDDGITMNETLKLVKALLLKPIQYIHISQKNFYGKVRKGEGVGIERLKLIHDLTKNKVALIGVGGLKNENGINYAIKSGLSEFVGVGMASLLNKNLGTLLKENKGNQINMVFDKYHPEKYSIPKNLWNFLVNESTSHK